MSTLLHPELLSLIFSFLAASLEIPSDFPPEIQLPEEVSLAKYAIVCKDWQPYIERYTFAQIHLTPSRLTTFQYVVQGPRRKYIQTIKLDVVLPSYTRDFLAKAETVEEQTHNNEVFTSTFQALFKTLHSWNWHDAHKGGIFLTARFYSTSDIGIRSNISSGNYGDSAEPVYKLNNIRRHSSYLRLSPRSPSRRSTASTAKILLPSVSIITRFNIDSTYSRLIWPATCSDIVASLPSLKFFEPSLCNNETGRHLVGYDLPIEKAVELRKKAREGKTWRYLF